MKKVNDEVCDTTLAKSIIYLIWSRLFFKNDCGVQQLAVPSYLSGVGNFYALSG